MREQNNEHHDWEREAVVVVSVGLLVAIVVGLVLAIAGALVVALFVAVALPLMLWAWNWFRPRGTVVSSHRGISLAMVIVGVVVVGVTALNVTSTAEHLQTNRDPGVYLTTGKWLATQGTLLVDGANAGFAGIEHVTGRTQGYHDPRDDGLLYPQFNHGFPVTLALSNWIGGDRLMFNLNPLIGGAFLLFLFIYARRFFVDWIALIAVGSAALNLVFWHFARDTYSEPLVALLLVLALLAVDDAVRFGAIRRWVFAGLLVGVSALVRIDAWFYIAIFGGIIAIHSWLKPVGTARFRTRDALAALGAMWVMGAIGFADLVLRSPQYLADLWPNVRMMLAAAGIGGLVAVTAVILEARCPRLVATLRTVWRSSGTAFRRLGSIGIVIFVAWALLWRPAYGLTRGNQAGGLVAGLMAAEGVVGDPTRSFYELSARWLTWYWGLIGVVIATIGWSLAVGRRRLKNRQRLYIPLILTGLALVPYIIAPSITPDQIWALRRFYPMGLIGIAMAVALTLAVIERWMRSREWRQWTEVVLVGVAAVALVAVPGVYAAPLATASTQVGMYGSTIHLCEQLPDDAAVLVEAGRLTAIYPAAIRSFCDVPVASLTRDAQRSDIDAVAASWKQLDRSLYIVATPNACFLGGETLASSEFGFTFPERTLTVRPDQTSSGAFAWKLGRWGDQAAKEARDSSWEIEIRTTWTSPDSPSVVAAEGSLPGARWWLQYRQTGMIEFWVNTESGPVGVAYPLPLDDDSPRTIPFGIDGDMIYIGCGSSGRTAAAAGIVAKSGSVEMGGVYGGILGDEEFLGEAEIRITGSG
jgi:hypothetical protein